MSPPLADETLRRYLLGELSEEDALALEEDYFDDPDVLARVRGTEDDLLDDYVGGRLKRRERLSFERSHLATPAQRERLVAASALRLLAGTPSASREPPGRAGRTGLAGWAALAAVLLAGLLVSRAGKGPWVAPEAPVSALPSSLPAQASAAPVLASLPSAAAALTVVLAPGATRAAGGPLEVRVSGGVQEVVLEFVAEPGALSHDGRLHASLATVEGREVWKDRAQPAAASPSGSLASARLPAALLAPDDYIVTLAADGAGPPLRYFLRVVE